MLRRRLTEIGATVAAAALGTTFFYCCVYQNGTYGCALFIAVPFAVGFVAGAILSRRPSVLPAMVFAFAAAMLIAAVLLLIGKEGMICILLALPLAFVPLLLGAAAGYTVFRRKFVPPPAGVLLVLAIGGMAYAEPHVLGGAPVVVVADSIVIDAPASRVWSAIVGLDAVPSNDWVYRAGLACPQRARITRPGPGGERVCTMSTGTLVEQIEVWEPERRLRWRSVTTPPPLRELNPFYDHVEAPHLRGYYAVPRGEFVLEPLDARHTRLTRRTWYAQRLYPAAYWQFWAGLAISHINVTVLEHVRAICS